MRLSIFAIGRLKDCGETDLVARYSKRLAAGGRSLALGPLAITELAEARHPEAGQRKADEAQRLLAAAVRADRRVILDEGGKLYSSQDFAKFLVEARDGGVRELAFLIGGPDGHGDEARNAADLVLALGPMTLPHGLARAVLAEQIYRAATIIGGHPYHRS